MFGLSWGLPAALRMFCQRRLAASTFFQQVGFQLLCVEKKIGSYCKNNGFGGADGRHPERMSIRVVEGRVEETGDHIHTSGLDFATCS
jgi:hypothetical protein